VVDWRQLGGLSPPELVSMLLRGLDATMRGLPDEAEDQKLSGLPQPLKVLWLLDWLDFEVAQGALLAYFLNSHGRHAPQAIEALRVIGAVRMARVLAEASELAGADGGLSNADRMDDLTDAFRAAADEEDWGGKLEAFLSKAVAAAASEPKSVGGSA